MHAGGLGAAGFAVPPSNQEPASGFVPTESITLVRNPAWDPRTDALRPAYPDRIEIAAAGSVEEALVEIEAGRADLMWNPVDSPTVPPDQIAPFQGDDGRGRVHVDDFDVVRGISMNLALPPFDDIHVRKALNYAIDKRRLIEILGGPLAAVGEGRCDASACEHVLAITRHPHEQIGPAVRQDLRVIGIDLEVDVLPVDESFAGFSDPQEKVPLVIGIAWVKAYISASSYFWEQFHSGVALGEDFGNGSLVGATPDQLERWGYDAVQVPNIDERIEACLPLVGAAQFECWAALDQYVTQNVVSWIPYAFDKFVAVTSSRVVHYSYDQLFIAPALDQIAVSE